MEDPLPSRRLGHVLIALAVGAAVVVAFAIPPMPQPLAYHRMADERSWLGIPNALNVLSNLPFAIVGALGLAARSLPRHRPQAVGRRLGTVAARRALRSGVALTALGSGYYHLAPDNGRLVWDRLPMTIGFMGLLTADRRRTRRAWPCGAPPVRPAPGGGAASVAYWYWSELGGGRPAPVRLVQFGRSSWLRPAALRVSGALPR